MEDRAGRTNVDGFCSLHELKKREEGRKKKGRWKKEERKKNDQVATIFRTDDWRDEHCTDGERCR